MAFLPGLICRDSGWRRRAFQLAQPAYRMFAAGAAHFGRRLLAAAKRRALGLAENQAALILAELDAAPARRLAGWYRDSVVDEFISTELSASDHALVVEVED
ncbi:hypothetical protein [Massilia sp. YIM B04103]|uniref:hypothetical protein n=1 Tax=Massilia sp. YIM B04103 TaxID=2963106 RepID=UPI00210DCDEA|nr:hypothetical protein [Massilia sp. YIM B04103]